MALKDYRKLTKLFGGILLIAFVAAILAYYKGYQHPLDLLSITGAIASTFGLLIVFFQVSALRSSSEAAYQAAQSTRDEVMAFLSVLDIDSYASTMVNYCITSKERTGFPPDIVGIQNESRQRPEVWHQM